MREGIGMGQVGQVGAMLGVNDHPTWRCEYILEKYWKAHDDGHNPGDKEIIHGVGNLLMNGGADILWYRATKRNPTTVASTLRSAFSTLSRIGVGNSTAAAAATQTALQGASKAYSSMAASYPTHTTGTSTAARMAAFRSVFTTAQANFAWQEWGIFNSASTGASAYRLLNRKVQSLGTKTCAAQWTFTATLTLS